MKNKKQRKAKAFVWTAAVGLSTLAVAATAFAAVTTANNAKASKLTGRSNDITHYITIQYKTTNPNVQMSGSRTAKIKTTEPFRVANRPSVTQPNYNLVGWTTVEDDAETLVAETQKFATDQVLFPLMRPVGTAIIEGPKCAYAALSGHGVIDEDTYTVIPPSGAEDHDFTWEITGDALSAGCTWQTITDTHGQRGKIVAPAYSGDQVLSGMLIATDTDTSQTTTFEFFLCPPYLCKYIEMPLIWWKDTNTSGEDEWVLGNIDRNEGPNYGLVGTSDPDTPIIGMTLAGGEMGEIEYTRAAGQANSFNPEKVYIGSPVTYIPDQFLCNIESMTDTEVVVPSKLNITGIEWVSDYVDLQNVVGISSSFMRGNENWNGSIPTGWQWGLDLAYIGNYFLDGCTAFDATACDGEATFLVPAAFLIGDAFANETNITTAMLAGRTAEIGRDFLAFCPELEEVTFMSPADDPYQDIPSPGLIYAGRNCLYNDKSLLNITFNCDGNAFEVCDGSFAWDNSEGDQRTDALNITGLGAGVVAENFENHTIEGYEAYRNLNSPVVITLKDKDGKDNVASVTPASFTPADVPNEIILDILPAYADEYAFSEDTWKITLNEIEIDSSNYEVEVNDTHTVATITINNKAAFAQGTNLEIEYLYVNRGR